MTTRYEVHNLSKKQMFPLMYTDILLSRHNIKFICYTSKYIHPHEHKRSKYPIIKNRIEIYNFTWKQEAVQIQNRNNKKTHSVCLTYDISRSSLSSSSLLLFVLKSQNQQQYYEQQLWYRLQSMQIVPKTTISKPIWYWSINHPHTNCKHWKHIIS
jgi:hypothetical protein